MKKIIRLNAVFLLALGLATYPVAAAFTVQCAHPKQVSCGCCLPKADTTHCRQSCGIGQENTPVRFLAAPSQEVHVFHRAAVLNQQQRHAVFFAQENYASRYLAEAESPIPLYLRAFNLRL